MKPLLFCGFSDEAAAAFAKVLSLDPTNSGAKRQLRELQAAGVKLELEPVSQLQTASVFAPAENKAEEDGAEFKAGDYVEAQWKDSEYPGWHNATVAKIDMTDPANPVYNIHYDDGGRWNACPISKIRMAPMDIIEKKKKAKQRRESGQDNQDDLSSMTPEEMAHMMKFMQGSKGGAGAGGAPGGCPQQ
jgi:hypothetical protein